MYDCVCTSGEGERALELAASPYKLLHHTCYKVSKDKREKKATTIAMQLSFYKKREYIYGLAVDPSNIRTL